MKFSPALIVMLTHNDQTVENAAEIFEQCKDSKAKFWGFKEEPLPLEKMKKLFAHMKDCGKTTFLEVVAYSEKEGLDGAKKALACNCDYLLGTHFSKSVNDFCKENNLKYLPFVGKIKNRPSVLEGDVEEIIYEAESYLAQGVFGIDLLGYRYTGDATKLNQEFISRLKAPVCLAGSINSYERLDEVKKFSSWTFTIGGAFFENKFEGSFFEQINKVYDYMR